MKWLNVNVIRKIDLKKADGCEHSDIDGKKWYFVKYSGEWILGQFDKQWYGWNFNWFGMVYAGLQLDSLSEVWEVEITKL